MSTSRQAPLHANSGMTQSYASSAGTPYTTQESDVNLSSQLWTSHVAANAILLRLPLAKTTLSGIRFFSLSESGGFRGVTHYYATAQFVRNKKSCSLSD